MTTLNLTKTPIGVPQELHSAFSDIYNALWALQAGQTEGSGNQVSLVQGIGISIRVDGNSYIISNSGVARVVTIGNGYELLAPASDAGTYNLLSLLAGDNIKMDLDKESGLTISAVLEKVNWSAIVDAPATYPPEVHAHALTDVTLYRRGSSSFKSAADYFDFVEASCLVAGGVITLNSDCTVTVAAGTCLVRETADNSGHLYIYDFPAATLAAIAAGTTKRIVVAQTTVVNGDGSVTRNVAAQLADAANESNTLTLAVVSNVNGTLHFIAQYPGAAKLLRSIIARESAIAPVALEASSGFKLTTGVSRTLQVEAGATWAGMFRYPHAMRDSAVKPITEVYGAHFGITLSSWPNAKYYSSGSDSLQDLAAGTYGCLWLYSSIDTDDWFVAYGSAQYATASLAASASAPSYLTQQFKNTSLFLGRLIFLANADSPFDLETAVEFGVTGTVAKFADLVNSYASLVNGKVPESQLPSYVDDVLEFDDNTKFPATGERGKIYVDCLNNATYRWTGTTYVKIGDGSSSALASTDALPEGTVNKYYLDSRARAALSATGSLAYNPTTGVLSYTTPASEPPLAAGTSSQYYRGDKTWQTLDKSAVGLGNVDNTSDANKPLSTAATTALAGKEPTIAAGSASQYWAGTKAWADFATSVRSAVLTGLSVATNAAVVATDSVLAAIGKIQAHLVANDSAIAEKEPAIIAGSSVQFWRGDKTWQGIDKNTVGLGNVDNTADINKNVLYAQTSAALVGSVAGTNTKEIIRYSIADNDSFRLLVGGTAANAGYVEIATADDGTEPIYVRQYTGDFAACARTLTLLTENGATLIPGWTYIGSSATAGDLQLHLVNSNRDAYLYLTGDGEAIGLWDTKINGNRWYTDSAGGFHASGEISSPGKLTAGSALINGSTTINGSTSLNGPVTVTTKYPGLVVKGTAGSSGALSITNDSGKTFAFGVGVYAGNDEFLSLYNATTESRVMVVDQNDSVTFKSIVSAGRGDPGEKRLRLQNDKRGAYFFLDNDGKGVGLWDETSGRHRWTTDTSGNFYAYNNIASGGSITAYNSYMSTVAGGPIYVGTKAGASYGDGTAVFRAVLDNPTGSASYLFEGFCGGASGTRTYFVRADGASMFAGKMSLSALGGPDQSLQVGSSSYFGPNNYEVGIAIPPSSTHWPFGICRGGNSIFSVDTAGTVRSAGGIQAENGSSITIQAAPGSSDSGDIIFKTGAGVITDRLFADAANKWDSLCYSHNEGTIYKLMHSGNYKEFALPLDGSSALLGSFGLNNSKNTGAWSCDSSSSFGFLLSRSGADQYYKIAILPASSGDSRDHISIDGIFDDNWWAANKTKFSLVMGNRNGFSYKFQLFGDAKTSSVIRAYTEADGSVSIWAATLGASWSTINLNITNAIGWVSVYKDGIPGTPTGTLVFDSSLPDTYKPQLWINADGMISRIFGRDLLTSGNYNTFAPTLTGAGASGSWQIDITGLSGGIRSQGEMAASTGQSDSRPAPGLRFNSVYNGNYPSSYGNMLSIGGSGAGQLFVGWSEVPGAHADNFIRSMLDIAATWSPWAKLLTDVNIEPYLPLAVTGYSKDITGTDLNAKSTTGFYKGSTLGNAPAGNTGWFFVIVQGHDSSWATQTAITFGSGNTANQIYTRTKSSGTWGPWAEQITTNNIAAQVAANLPAQEAWHDVTLPSGWILLSPGDKVQYMKDSLGFVHMRGRAQTDTLMNSLTLPVGYRPASDVWIAGVSNTLPGFGAVLTALGAINKINSTVSYVMFDAVTFRAA